MCMVEMAIFNIQRAITLKVGAQELRFMCSACHLMVLTFESSFMKICQVVLKLWSRHKNLHAYFVCRGITRVTVHVFCMLPQGLTFV